MGKNPEQGGLVTLPWRLVLPESIWVGRCLAAVGAGELSALAETAYGSRAVPNWVSVAFLLILKRL